MKSSLAILLAASLSTVTASVPFYDQSRTGQTTLVLENKVPGENPLTLCRPKEFPDCDPKDFLVQIERVDLAPNPPIPGEILTVNANGTVRRTIEQDAYCKIEVKYGFIKLLNTKADLCEQIGNIDMECPIENGRMTIQKDLEIPKEVPPGKYTVHVECYTADDEPLTCLDASVTFSPMLHFGL